MSTSKITKGSILISLNIILFLISKVFNIADLTLLTLSSSIICLSIIKFGIKYSFLILISSSLTSFMFGLIEYCLIYFIFFGFYPILKFYTENINNKVIGNLMKLLYFITLFFIFGYIYLNLFLPIKITTSIILAIFIIFLIIFIMYDIMLTKIILFFHNNKFINNL